MIGLPLNGLGVVKRSQDGVVNERPRRRTWIHAANEFNGRWIMPAFFWGTSSLLAIYQLDCLKPNHKGIMMLFYCLLALNLLFLSISLLLVKESIREQEHRAVRVGSFCVLLLVMVPGILIAIPQSHTIAGIGFIFLLLLTVGLCLPGPQNPKALQGTTGYLVADPERFDESLSVFVRTRGLPEGSAVYQQFYQANPELEKRDRRRREKGFLGRLGNIDGAYPANNAMVEATDDIPHYLGHYARSIPVSELKHPEMTPEKATPIIKNFALHLGADLVGICKVNPAWTYSKRGEIHYDNWEDWGKEISDLPPYALVFLLEMSRDHVMSAPHTPSLAESATKYAKGAYISTILARWFSHMGYRAFAEHTRNYDLILPPLAVDAGLGEIGRQGYLIAPKFGARVRLFAVLTDMPLLTDKPVSLGVEAFCRTCLKCAESCPSRSIPKGEKTICRGVEKWKLDEESCFAYWARAGTDCCICMAICPFSRPNTRFHNTARWVVAHSLLGKRILPHIDNLIYGRRWKTRRVPDWLAYPKRSEINDITGSSD